MAVKQVHNGIVTRNVVSASKAINRLGGVASQIGNFNNKIQGAAGVLSSSLRGAVFFDAPSLFSGEYPIAAEPCFPYASSPNGAGMFWVPKVGDEIEVEILTDDGSFDTSDVQLPEPRYRCMVYSDAADIAEEFRVNYPNRMGWKTNSGHILLFDDTVGQSFVQLRSSKGHELLLEETSGVSKVLLKSKLGHQIILDESSSGSKLLVKSVSGHVIDLDDVAATLSIKNAVATQSMVLDGAGNVTGKAALLHDFNSPRVRLGTAAAFHASISENLLQQFDIHFHNGVHGPTSPPLVTMASKAGTPMDVSALNIIIRGNI